MSAATIFYENFADSAAISGGSWLAGAPLANVQTLDIGQAARTTDTLETSSVMNIDLLARRYVEGIVLGPINITQGKFWRVRGYADALHSVTKYDSGNLLYRSGRVPSLSLHWEDPNFWDGITPYTQDVDLPIYLYHVIPSTKRGSAICRWWSVEIFDSINTSGYIQVGRLLMSRIWQPSVNYSYGDNSFGVDVLSTTSESIGGVKDIKQWARKRTLRLSFPVLTEFEVFAKYFRMNIGVGLTQQVFIVPDLQDTQFSNKRSFLGRFRTLSPIQQAFFQGAAVAVDLEEVL